MRVLTWQGQASSGRLYPAEPQVLRALHGDAAALRRLRLRVHLPRVAPRLRHRKCVARERPHARAPQHHTRVGDNMSSKC